MWMYPEIRTLGGYIEYFARHDPERLALIEGKRKVSFLEYDKVANTYANALMKAGIERDDRVGFFGPNSFDYYFSLVGTVKAGAAYTVFNWRLAVPELVELVKDSQAKLTFVDREYEEVWKQVIDKTGIKTIWFDGQDTLEKQFAKHSDVAPDIYISEDDTAIQLYTSGTTGRSKGVMLTHGGFNRMRLCEHFEEAYDWKDGDIFINPLPNFHLLSIGIAFQCLYNGVAVSIVRGFDLAHILKVIRDDKPSLLTLTPTMLQMLLDHPDAQKTDFSCIRTTLYAGSPISLGLIKRAIKIIPGEFMQFYGATEANGAFSILRPNEHNLNDEKKLQSCGRPLPLMKFKIVDGQGQEVPVGESGELMVLSPAITKGYWQQPETTEKVFDNGWYKTGDVAKKDEEGLYYIVDRVKDMIVSGGENIYSAEVENVLSVHPDVSAVAVIGVPSERWGEEVKAVIIAKPDTSPSVENLIAWCRDRLAGYKVPKSIDFIDAFPLVPSGKVSKKDLRAPYWEGHDRNVG